ncbi:MAG: hypothetical protein IJY28_05950 [Clostridia bacterium]|nr:hypothetical protein [Clostridia bacterium]
MQKYKGIRQLLFIPGTEQVLCQKRDHTLCFRTGDKEEVPEELREVKCDSLVAVSLDGAYCVAITKKKELLRYHLSTGKAEICPLKRGITPYQLYIDAKNRVFIIGEQRFRKELWDIPVQIFDPASGTLTEQVFRGDGICLILLEQGGGAQLLTRHMVPLGNAVYIRREVGVYWRWDEDTGRFCEDGAADLKQIEGGIVWGADDRPHCCANIGKRVSPADGDSRQVHIPGKGKQKIYAQKSGAYVLLYRYEEREWYDPDREYTQDDAKELLKAYKKKTGDVYFGLYDAQTGELLRTQHTEEAHCPVFVSVSPDGAQLAYSVYASASQAITTQIALDPITEG